MSLRYWLSSRRLDHRVLPTSACRLTFEGGRGLLFVVALISGLATAHHSWGRELITDGDFENGTEGWDSLPLDQQAEWFLDGVGSYTPLSGFATSADGPGEGSYVVSDQLAPVTLSLFQPFTVPEGAESVIFSYDMFVNDWSNSTVFDPDQHARVDIIDGDASVFDVGDGVVVNTFIGTDGGPLPNPFTHYEFDITPFVASGGEFQVRFLTVNRYDAVNLGVDNVSVQTLPEPSAWILALLGFAALWWFRPRRTVGRPA